jgi:phage-related minor tail protein
VARTLALNLLLKVSGSETLGQAEKKISKLQDRLGKFNEVANKVGVAAGVAFGAGLVGAMDASKGRAKLQAQLGLTEKDSAKIGAVAGKVFSQGFGESMDDVNTALTAVVQNMDGMRDASSGTLEHMAKQALTVGQVLDEDVGRVTAGVTNLLRTGLAKSADEAFDIIARGAQLGGNRAADLLDTFEEYAVQFQNMGLSGKQAMGLITQGLQAGARNADLVADTIKEFSIEAVAGSDKIRKGLNSLGVDADKVISDLGAGGPRAAKAFDLVLDRLRAIEDPVKRNAVAVELFGTKAEDMGQALYALDPDTAEKSLGAVAGAAEKAGKALTESASAKIEKFKRTLVTTFVGVIGNEVIPKIEGLINWLGKIGVTPKGIVAAGAVLAGLAVSVKLVTGALALYSTALKVAAAGSKIASGAMWLFNAALRANPIGIVVTALTALVAAVVLAYNKSETFRKIVQAAWQGIVTAAKWAWSNVLKPVFDGIKSVITGVVIPAVLWLWKNVFQPAWNGISFAVKVAWGIIRIVFTALVYGLKNTVGPAVNWLWKNVFQPAWKGISFAVKVAWGIVKIIFAAWKTYLQKVIGPVVTWLWKNIVQPAFQGVGKVISAVWNTVVRPAFDKFKSGVKLVASAFRTAVSNIGKWWNKIRDAAKKPVKWVIDTVYTGGLKKVWDAIAVKVGAPKLPDAPKFASGGKINGPGGTKSDRVPILASRGEFVVNAKATRRFLPLLERINRTGGPDAVTAKATGFMGDPGGVLPGFAGGGLIDGISKFLKAAKDWFAQGAVKAAKWVTDPLLSLGDKTLGRTSFGRMLMGLVRQAVKSVLGWIGGKEDKLGGMGQRAVNAARSQIGVPYSWGGGGPHGPSYGFAQGAGIRGFDCSSLMQYAWYKASGKIIPRTTYQQMPWVKRISQPRPGALGFPHSGHVFMYSGNGRIVEAPYTGARVRETAARRVMFWGMPPFASADSGVAVLRPGMNMIHNGTGGPEPLVDPRKYGGNTYQITVNVAPGGDLAKAGAEVVRAIKEYERRNGTMWRK